MMEGPLTIMSQQPQLAAPALHAWQCLVDAFAMAGQMRVPKRVDLLARPMYHALMLSSKEVVQQVCRSGTACLAPNMGCIASCRCYKSMLPTTCM